MANINLKFAIDGQPISLEEIAEVERKRTVHVLREMRALGADLRVDGKAATPESIEQLDPAAAKALLVDTKFSLGAEGMRRLYRDKLAASDDVWRNISKDSAADTGFKPSVVELEVQGLRMGKLLAHLLTVTLTHDERWTYVSNPEHFVISMAKGRQMVMETLGMHGEPVYMKMRVALSGLEAAARDPDTTVILIATAELASDATPMGIHGMHQLKVRPDGIGMKLGIYFPSATPDELVEGHKWHLAVEFARVMEMAAEARLPVRAAIADMAVRTVTVLRRLR
jgi:hypothetical protein